MSLKAKDYLTLPERIENVITVEMSPKNGHSIKRWNVEHVLGIIDDDDVERV